VTGPPESRPAAVEWNGLESRPRYRLDNNPGSGCNCGKVPYRSRANAVSFAATAVIFVKGSSPSYSATCVIRSLKRNPVRIF